MSDLESSTSRFTSMRPVPLALLFGFLLANLAPVYGKGGGKSSSNSNSSNSKSGSSKGSGKGSGSSSSSSSSYKNGGVTIISTGGTTVCYNENNQVIKCPPNSARTNMIIGAVVGGIFGSILLGCLIYWVVRRCKEKRRQPEKKPIISSLSFGKKQYKPLHDSEENV
ncbi:hypothetical protein C8R43DRAFT_687963 [Mycena crocata]|nr:hypothetical protein C8R43DRAFT_687963 [Mycena crocata]